MAIQSTDLNEIMAKSGGTQGFSKQAEAYIGLASVIGSESADAH